MRRRRVWSLRPVKGRETKPAHTGGILMRQIRQSLFCFSILLVTLFMLFNRIPAQAAETHVSCPQDGFVIDHTLSDKAGIPGTNMTIETVDFLEAESPIGDSGQAIVVESGKKIYYLRDSTRPGMPLPAYLEAFFRLGDLLVVSACEGASSCSGWLFLFRVRGDSLELVDTWENGHPGDLRYDFELESASWKAADGGALFRINLPYLRFSFYVKATHEGFAPVFDPSVYEPFCESVDKLPATDLGMLRQSCVCTFFLEKDKKKARQECRAKIERYYAALIRKAATFPDRRMNYEQYHEYLSRRLSEGWEYQAIGEAFEGPLHELAGGADLVKVLKHIRTYDLEDTMKVFAIFSRIKDAFRPEGKVSLAICDRKGGAK
jgi:hypothetical protein